MTLHADQCRLGEAEHQAIFDNDIKPDLFAGAKPSRQPVAIIFGGQPGAGKSAAMDLAVHDLQAHGGAVQVIGDDLRGYHPQYARWMGQGDKTAAFYADHDTRGWIEKAIDAAKALRVHIVIEETMLDADKVAAMMTSLRDAGYTIDARVLAVASHLSEQVILQRYENQRLDRGAGRMTAPQIHQAAYDGMLHTLARIEGQKLADRVTVYRRGAHAIYHNEHRGGLWKREPQAHAVVESERARPMTAQERKEYRAGLDALADILAHPERRASAHEVHHIATLQRQAQSTAAASPDQAQVVKAARRRLDGL